MAHVVDFLLDYIEVVRRDLEYISLLTFHEGRLLSRSVPVLEQSFLAKCVLFS